MSHATLPITSVLRPTRRVAAVLAVLAMIAIAAVLVVRTIGGPDESRVAVAVSGR